MKPYPWYELVEGDDTLMQGDFIISCPVIVSSTEIEIRKLRAGIEEYDVVVMSQSCDLAQKKLEQVLLCPFWSLEEFAEKNEFFKGRKGKEALRQGNVPGYHLLNQSEIREQPTDFLVVDFYNVFGIPFDFLLDLAQKRGKRLRLLSPFREHLAQAFARFFMRVGLPVDIPAFK